MNNRPTRLFLFFVLLLNAFAGKAQDCTSILHIQLENIEGGYYSGQEVKLVSRSDGKTFSQKSDVNGNVKFTVPCGTFFDLTVSNSPKKYEASSHPTAGGQMSQSLMYQPNLFEIDKQFQMTPTEIAMVDAEATLVPDSVFVKNSKMPAPVNSGAYVAVNFTISDMNAGPLVGETIIITGKKRHKSVKGVTDANGQFSVYLLKGDEYSVNFKYHSDYASEQYEYTKGSATVNFQISYLGTKEIERRKAEEEQRIREEEERLKLERERFEKECAERKIAMEEAYLKEYTSGAVSTPDTVISAVLNRNNWPNKLIVCDLTGSMNPYASQLALWYKINLKKEQNLQFVFFNDGDNKSDDEKIIGKTGGIYYSPGEGLAGLAAMMATVSSHGHGGDCPENNMEALIEGVKLAAPFDELVMIVDNHAPVKDIELLANFNEPVHIILCGAVNRAVLLDYLLIAWKTNGSIHTIEEDITGIGRLTNGQQIKIGGINYRVMGNEFIKVD